MLSGTFVVDLEAYRSHAFIRLEVKPHLMGHANDEVRNKAASQTDEKREIRHKQNRSRSYCLIADKRLSTPTHYLLLFYIVVETKN